jgi:glycerate kinase
VELAECAGLAMVRPPDRDPERTGTAGVGSVLDLALDRLRAECDDQRPMEVFLALGGSGTVDGGIGALRAMGVEIVGPEGHPDRPLLGRDLAAVRDLRVPPAILARWAGVRIRVLADVRNPLSGPTGAARIFGPQKGASPAAVERLEHGLAHWGALLADRFGVDPDLSGAGAAGGVGIALAATLGATIEPGFDVVASLLGLDAAIGERDLVITSEGRLDRQSLMGKVIGGVLDRAERHGVPVIAVPGAVEADLPDGIRRRFAAIRSLEETVGPDLARHRTLDALRQTASAAMRDLFR